MCRLAFCGTETMILFLFLGGVSLAASQGAGDCMCVIADPLNIRDARKYTVNLLIFAATNFPFLAKFSFSLQIIFHYLGTYCYIMY